MVLDIATNFEKRINSTKRPNAFFQVTMSLKGQVSMSNPQFLIDVSANSNFQNASYVRWNFLNRDWYYYVDDVVIMRNNIFILKCSLDYMATFRTEILNSNQLIAYSTVKSNDKIQDRRLIPSATQLYIGRTGKSVLPNNNPCIVLNCASQDGVATKASGGIGQYVFDSETNFSEFIQSVFKMYDAIEDISVVVEKYLSGTTPDNLISARYYYYTPPLTGYTSAIIGTWNSGEDAKCISEKTIDTISQVNVDWTDSVPVYLRNSTYISASLFVPFVGVIAIDVDELANSTALVLNYHFDNVNGTFKCELEYRDDRGIVRISQTFGGSVSAEMTFSTFSNNPIQSYIEAANVPAQVASLNFAGALNSLVSSVTSTTQAQTSIAGGYESRLVLGNRTNPVLTLQFREPQGRRIRDVYGAPYAQQENVNQHLNGYIQTSNAEYGLSVTTLGRWHGVICETMNAGFFVE